LLGALCACTPKLAHAASSALAIKILFIREAIRLLIKSEALR
jgi:hypothetical protein